MADVVAAGVALADAETAIARRDIDGAVAHLSAAIRSFTAAGDNRRAAVACCRLGDLYANAIGNRTAGRAWFARARRLVADEPPCVEQGWVAVAAIGCDVDDPAELMAAADLALDRARRFGDVNLETKALADSGLALVNAGEIAAGMAVLDEAMALASGPADDADTVGKSVCSFFTACYFAADFARAGSWADLLRQRRLIAPEPGAPIFLSSHCDSVHATLLIELGRWGEAEAILVRAIAEFEAMMGIPAWHPAIVFADLRVRQGRLAEAEALLLGRDQAVEALLPAARLHLARGDIDLARATARRGLRLIGVDRLRGIELHAVVVEAELASGDIAAAQASCAELAARAGDLDVPTLRARAAAAHAHTLAAAGDVRSAIDVLERAVDALDADQLPWRRATLLLELAELHEVAGDRGAAIVDAKTAAAVLATLDVLLGGRHAAVLDRLVGRPRRGTAELTRDGRLWSASSAGTTVRLPATKGLAYLAELISRPGVEQHVLDLVDRVEGVPSTGGADRRALGDAGELLDRRSRQAYRQRIIELRTDIDEAIAENRYDSAERMQSELDQLVAQLAAAFGLGGRERRAASAAERARLNVTRAVRAAIVKLAEALPEAAAVLGGQVRTGMYCAFEPDDDDVRWIVQS